MGAGPGPRVIICHHHAGSKFATKSQAKKAARLAGLQLAAFILCCQILVELLTAVRAVAQKAGTGGPAATVWAILVACSVIRHLEPSMNVWKQYILFTNGLL